jgi:hypothetical protein
MALGLLSFTLLNAAEWYVSPTGSPSGDGSSAHPWDLHTGIQANSIVKPGDTIWVRGGTYTYPTPWQFQVNLTGTSTAPIVIRRYPGEWAVLDLLDNGDEFVMDHGGRVIGTDSSGNPITAGNNSDYVWLWGLEITATGIPRATSSPGSFGIGSIVDVAIYGTGAKLINCYIHDMHGVGFWATSSGAEINGTLIGNMGWNAPDRGHGHNLYVQNDGSGITKRIKNVFLYNSFDIGMQWYGSGAALIQNITADGATIVNAGAPIGAGTGQLVIAGGGASKQNLTYVNGWSFVSPSLPGGFSEIGWVYDGLNQDVDVENNFWGNALSLGHWNQLKFLNNTVQGAVTLENYDGSSPPQSTFGWTLDFNTYAASTTFRLGSSHVDSNGNPVVSDNGLTFSQWVTSLPGQELHSASNAIPPPRVVVQPNDYEPGRANIIIYNPQSSATVAVDLSRVGGLKDGDPWELRDALNFRGNPVLSGTYSSSDTMIQIPMNGLTAAQVNGWNGTVPHTAPLFGEFVFLGGAAYDGSISSKPGCTYILAPAGQAFTAAGGTGSITVTAPPGCAWGTTSGPIWITGSTPGSGNGTFTYQVLPNTGVARSATLALAGISFGIEQEASSVPGLNIIGSIPHLAAQENWTTEFTLVNKSNLSALARLDLFGDPGGALTLPLAFPQQPAAPNPLLASSLDRTLAANALLVIDSAGPQTPPVQTGSAQLSATGAVDGFAIFHLIPSSQEAVVPMEARNANSYLLVFDNTGGSVLGVAVENVSSRSVNINVVIRDDSGVQIGTGNVLVAGYGHTSFVLSSQFPVTANQRGTIEFDRPTGGQISVLGIRTSPLGTSNTLTTIPALADVGTTGGSIAHFASGNGWQSTFVLVNAGSGAAQLHLSFFDDHGNLLPLPLGFPQSGGGPTSTASSVDRTLATGATLVVQSSGVLTDPLLVGSAQLATNGNIGGFVIFRYNPTGQEAVVPLENRLANAFLLAFDNTAGTRTGIAINSISSQTVNILVVIRDDAGAQIASDTLTVAANGHLAFTLASDKYPSTADIRGTIEFDAPAGTQIGVLGIRIPVSHTFTSLPALIK